MLFILMLIVLGLFGCAQKPAVTEGLINMQAVSREATNFDFTFRDDREERMKTERHFVLQYKYPTWVFSSGDLAYDLPLNVVFEKMFSRRFGNNPTGHKAEVTLKVFHNTTKPHELSGLPIIGLLTLGADVEWHGILKAEIAILDKDGKFIFHKIYETDIREMKSPRGSQQSALEATFDMLNKAFTKFAEELATDIGRIRFNMGYRTKGLGHIRGTARNK